MDFGPLWEQLVTTNNLLIMLGCGVAMEAFKKVAAGFAASPWGKRLAYLAPAGWAWAALFTPIGLAPEKASIGEKLMLGLILGAASGWVYSTARGLLKKRIVEEELKK